MENEANKNVGDLELIRKLADAIQAAWQTSWNGHSFSSGAVAQAALSTIRQQSSVKVDDGWQPIETAPKDKNILGYGPKVGINHVFWSQAEEQWQKVELSAYYQLSKMAITHWMPLPKPPQALRSSEMPNGSGKED